MRQLFPQKPPLGTPINWSHPLAKVLVGFWAFQEGGGDLANDLSGNANHGILKNMAFPATTASGWNPGKFGPAPKFDGEDDYVSIPNFNLTFPATMIMWVKPSAGGLGKSRTFLSRDGGSTFLLYYQLGTTSISLYDGSDNVGTAGLLQENEWQQIGMTFDSNGNGHHWHNGIQDLAFSTVNEPTNPFELRIGEWLTYNFNGQIDQVRIYNRALPEAEIINSYLDPFGMFKRNNLWDYVTAPPTGAVINQFQKVNIGADLYDGTIAI